ncbi:hypothetical protein C8Q78DRAFT_176742 [Trametes maxima]|nr:hypothetical protein C8Q78DRAFT_176742 [Trametes maxima]
MVTLYNDQRSLHRQDRDRPAGGPGLKLSPRQARRRRRLGTAERRLRVSARPRPAARQLPVPQLQAGVHRSGQQQRRAVAHALRVRYSITPASVRNGCEPAVSGGGSGSGSGSGRCTGTTAAARLLRLGIARRRQRDGRARGEPRAHQRHGRVVQNGRDGADAPTTAAVRHGCVRVQVGDDTRLGAGVGTGHDVEGERGVLRNLARLRRFIDVFGDGRDGGGGRARGGGRCVLCGVGDWVWQADGGMLRNLARFRRFIDMFGGGGDGSGGRARVGAGGVRCALRRDVRVRVRRGDWWVLRYLVRMRRSFDVLNGRGGGRCVLRAVHWIGRGVGRIGGRRDSRRERHH